MIRPGKTIKATTVEDIPNRNYHEIAEPCARIDMKQVPYSIYTEFVKECNERGLTYRQLFTEVWKFYRKKK